MDGETRIVECSECGKKVRIKDNVEKWACPECGTINVNNDYIPEVDDINPEKHSSNTDIIRKTDVYAWVALGLGVAALVFLLIFPLASVVFAIVSLILVSLSYKNYGKNIIAKIGKVSSIVTIVVIIIYIIVAGLILKHSSDIIHNIYSSVENNTYTTVDDIFNDTKNESRSTSAENTSTLETFSVKDGRYAKGSTVIAKSAIETGSEVIYRGTELEFVGELQDGSAVIRYGGKTYKVGYDCIKAK